MIVKKTIKNNFIELKDEFSSFWNLEKFIIIKLSSPKLQRYGWGTSTLIPISMTHDVKFLEASAVAYEAKFYQHI